MVTRFVAGATMSPARFTDLGAVARAGRALHSLHTATDGFSTDFSLFEVIDEYKRLLASKRAQLPSGYDELQATAEETRAALGHARRPLVPSHCDPLCENFLDTGEQMMLIDYEYAANNDPMWDLGDLSVEGQFGEEQDAVLLQAYFGAPAPAHEVARMVAYKAMCDLLWTLWGVVQHVNGNTAEDFWAYAVGRFERCKALMSSAAYADHLAVIRTGVPF
jgi:thiamine kinase-like enzyme